MMIGTTVLNNGLDIPQIGIGGWAQKREQIANALSVGYRLIDTAAQYGNEEEVGAGIRTSGVPRHDIFLTTKLWTEDIRQRRVREAFKESLQRLGMEYVDLYLIHWPAEGFEEAWLVMETLYREGLARAIGVSNFQPHHLERLKQKRATVIPAVNQIESHPYFTNNEVVEECENQVIRCEAWCPLGGPQSRELSDENIMKAANKYGKTSAQIILRWHIQRGVIVIPKSAHRERMEENLDIFDFELTEDECAMITRLDRGKRLGAHPDHFDF